MNIPVLHGYTPLGSRSDPVVTARTTTSPLSYSIIQDERLAKAIQPLAIQRGIKINRSAWTDSLLNLLLQYRRAPDLEAGTAKSVQDSIKHLDEEWYKDIQSWCSSSSLSWEDPNTGRIKKGDLFERFIRLILQPLLTRRVFINFDQKGDISETCQTSFLRLGYFHSYHLNQWGNCLELNFRVNNQIKGLILSLHDIKTFDDFGVFFQHPKHPNCILFNPFACDEFATPRHGAANRRAEFERKIWDGSDGERSGAGFIKACFDRLL
jgi:hypothetical protein